METNNIPSKYSGSQVS